MESRRNSLPPNFKFSLTMTTALEPLIVDNLNQIAAQINQIHRKFHELKDENSEKFLQLRTNLINTLKQYNADGGKIMALQFAHDHPKQSFKETLFNDPTDKELPFSTLFSSAESKKEAGYHICKQTACPAERIRDEVAAELIQSLQPK